MFETMKGDFRSFSRKGLRSSRSLRVVQDSVVIVENIKPSIWETMPYELLRDVLMRIEASDNNWPERKNVVACGGVCRIWREIVREIVKATEVSAKLTFPISLKQPGPRDSLIHCYIKRNQSTQTFYLYLSLNEASNDNGKFLLAARKFRHATCTDYVISTNSRDFSKGSSSYIGKLRSNFLGSKFTVYDAQPQNAGVKINKFGSTKLVGVKQVSPKVPPGNYPVAHISYELNVLGSRGPRRMSCVMDAIPASSILPGGIAPTQTEFVTITNTVDPFLSFPFFRSKSSRVNLLKSNTLSSPQQINKTLIMKNKLPRWHEQLQCWCLNFNGRVTVASVKNFQLVGSGDDIENENENENVIVQFGKVGKDVFTMDYMYPISAFQAFAICLSSFDTKIACE